MKAIFSSRQKWTWPDHQLLLITYSIAILTVTSPIVINVPTRGSLAVKTKDSLFCGWQDLNIKRLVCKQWVSLLTSLHDFYDSLHLHICPVRSLDLFVASILFMKGSSCCVIRRNFTQNFKPLSACRFVESHTSVISHVLVFCFGSFLLQVSCSYLIELMFLELDVWDYSSFDRSGTTELKYSCLRASLLTASLNNVLNMHDHHL